MKVIGIVFFAQLFLVLTLKLLKEEITCQKPATDVPIILLDKSGVSNLIRGDSEETTTYVILQKLPSKPIKLH